MAYVTAHYPPELGAGSARAGGLSRALAALGHELEVFTLAPSYPWGRIAPGYRNALYRREMADGVTVHRVLSLVLSPARLWLRQLGYLPSACVALTVGLRRAARRRFDAVVCSSPPPFFAMVGLGLSLLTGAPLVIEVRDPWPESLNIVKRHMGLRLVGCALRVLSVLLYRRASRIIAVSDGLTDQLRSAPGVAPAKLVTIPGGADASFLDKVRRSRALAQAQRLRACWGLTGRRVVGYAGTLGLAQGLEDVLTAAGALSSQASFVLVGEGSLKSRLVSLAGERGLQTVQFHPAVSGIDDLLAVYYLFDVALIPLVKLDLYEAALPLKAIELAVLNRRIVAADYRQLRSFFRGYEGVEFYAPGNPGALAAAIERALVREPRDRFDAFPPACAWTWAARGERLETCLLSIVGGTKR